MNEAFAGDICAMFGVDCNSGDTFVSKGSLNVNMVSDNLFTYSIL